MSSTAWADDIRRLHDAAAGVLNLDVVRRCDAPGLILAAVAGNADAARLLLDVNDFLAQREVRQLDAKLAHGGRA